MSDYEDPTPKPKSRRPKQVKERAVDSEQEDYDEKKEKAKKRRQKQLEK